METKAEYFTDSFVVDKLLMRDMVLAIEGGRIAIYGLMALAKAEGRDNSLYLACAEELNSTLTQIYDRWPELAN